MPPPDQPGDESPTAIENAISDAKLLIQRASETGISIDKAILDEIFTAAGRQPHDWSPAHEVSFWQNYALLCEKLKPITAECLKDWEKRCSQGPIVRHSLITSMMILSVVTLLWIVAVSYLYTSGRSLVMDLENAYKELEDITATIQQLDHKNQNGTKAVAPPKYHQIASTITVTRVALINYHSSSFLLQPLRSIVNSVSPAPIRADEPETSKPILLASNVDPVSDIKKIYELASAEEQQVRGIVSFLDTTLLPVLYGLLGACVYVLRTLSNGLSNRTISRHSLGECTIRLVLGALCGMIAAWLLPSTNDNKVVPLPFSTFALAFVAGYAVEVVFAALEKAVAKLSGESPKPTAAASSAASATTPAPAPAPAGAQAP